MSIMPALKMSEFRKDFKSHIGNYDKITNYNDFRTLAFKGCTPKMDPFYYDKCPYPKLVGAGKSLSQIS